MPASTAPNDAARPVPVGQRGRRRELLAGGGLLLACAVACSLPLLIGAGVVGSFTALLSGATTIAAGLALAAVVLGAWWVLRRGRASHASAAGEDASGCTGGCSC